MSAPPCHHQRESFQAPEGDDCTYSGANLPEVGRNAVILPPLGDHGRLSSSAILESEDDRHGQQHNRTKQAKRRGSASPVTSQGRTCGAKEEEGTLLLGANGDTAAGRNSSSHWTTTTTPTNIGRGDDPTNAAEGNSTTTAKDDRESGCCPRSDDDQCLRDAEHRKSFTADAKNSDPVVERETKEQDDSKAGDTPGDIVVVEATGGTVVDPEVDERAGTPSRGRTGRGRDPVSPVAAIRARVGLGLRNVLAFGSEAQVSPASASPQRVSMGWKRSPDRLKQAGAKRLSPLSWNRLKPGRNKQDSPGKVAPAAFFGDTPGGDLGDSDGCNKEENLCHNDNKRPIPSDDPPNACVDGPAIDDETKTKDIQARCTESTTHADGGVASGGRNMQGPDPEPDESRHNDAGGDRKGKQGLTTEEKVTGDLHQEDTAARQPPATAAAGPPEAAKHARRVLARDNTLTSRDEWPELLDSEPDPDLWALDKGEDDVLAAAKSMGSVLVRVVTWNLHAKPTPAADKLRETILPPGKVSEFFRPRQGLLVEHGTRSRNTTSSPSFARHELTFVLYSEACSCGRQQHLESKTDLFCMIPISNMIRPAIGCRC